MPGSFLKVVTKVSSEQLPSAFLLPNQQMVQSLRPVTSPPWPAPSSVPSSDGHSTMSKVFGGAAGGSTTGTGLVSVMPSSQVLGLITPPLPGTLTLNFA